MPVEAGVISFDVGVIIKQVGQFGVPLFGRESFYQKVKISVRVFKCADEGAYEG